ncbi:MAG: DUF2207 domain-containing protein [Proteobacteria bacterium]|nr:DUF2207 domain-containing protein [Pseudomonadota bacterium]
MLLRGIVFAFFVLFASAAWAEEAILSYDSRIVVGEDGALDVTETILVRAEGRQIRRGIYRDFPTDYRLPNGTWMTTTFDVTSVTLDGGPVKWTTERKTNGTRVRIGDANVFLRTGEYTYTISYRTERQLYFGEGFDELYYNVTGDSWAFPIASASATVLLPAGAVIGETRAFTGRQGAEGQAFTSEFMSEREVRFTTTGRLGPGEGLTIIVTWPEGFVTRPTEAQKTANFLADNLSLIVAYIGLLMVIGYFYYAWLQVGKDPDEGPIYARYDPPRGISPGAMSYVTKRGYRNEAFTAAIVNMAVKGYLTIREKGRKKFILSKTGNPARLSEGEKAIARKLLGNVSEIETKTKNHKDFERAMTAQENVLEKNHEGISFVRNQKHFWIGAGISLGVVILSLLTTASVGIVNILLAIGFVAFYGLIIFLLKSRSNLFSGGGSILGKLRLVGVIIFVGFHFAGMVGSLLFQNFFILVPFALILAVNVLFFFLLEKPTLEGRRLLDGIEGFKKYLSLAEKDRLEFHTGEITPEVFEKYLPFAIALGVETRWGKAFDKAMLKAGMDPGSYHPVWYVGRGHLGSFSSGNFASSFGGAFSGAISSASAPPASAGSGGGGFAGGGGGGGGGGGW